jgi:hypothetical protein
MTKYFMVTLKAATVGAILGVLAAHALFLGWWTLAPWGIAGLLIGYQAQPRNALVCGIVYGFVLVFVFLIFQYNGDRSLAGRLPFFALLGLFGSGCGLILTGIGRALQSAAPRQR